MKRHIETSFGAHSSVGVAGKDLLRRAIALALAGAVPVAHAQTWSPTPADSIWTNGANWSSGSPPSGDTAVAQFGPTNGPFVSISPFTHATVGTLAFTGGPAYTFLVGLGSQLSLHDAGVQITSSPAPQFIVMGGELDFGMSGSSTPTTAGSSILTTQHRGKINFFGSATAQNAALTVADGTLTFSGNATAGNSSVITSAGGLTVFANSATAGNATLITESGGILAFSGSATAGAAVLVANSNANVDFSGLVHGTQVTAGSIEGDGTYILGGGGTNLTVGALNTSTTLSGKITQAETGGSLTKVGTGTLTLTGTANDYSGGTFINGGVLRAASDVSLGAASGALSFGGGTLQFGGDQFTSSRAITLNVGDGTIDTAGFSGTLSGSVGGMGSLVKTGAGVLALTGTSSFTGQTVVNSGTLKLTGGATINGTSGVQIAQSAGSAGTLIVSGPGTTLATAGVIVVGVAGAGTLTVDNGATVTAGTIGLGQTAGSSGTLNIGTGGLSGGISAGTIVNAEGSGVVNLNFTDSTYTLAASLRNTITLNMLGSGTVILTGSNTYSGGTNLQSGILRITSATNLGGVGGGLNFDGGELQLGATVSNLTRPITLGARGGTIDTGAFVLSDSGTISGTGALTKLGTGTLQLTGTATYTGGTTVSAGTLRGTTNNVQGNIVNNGNVTFAQASDGTYAATMSGNGTLTKVSSGNLTLSGTNTYAGLTTVTGGILTVDGSISSPVTVGLSGTLAGTGTINGSMNVLGKVSPGNVSTPLGTLLVNGDMTFASSSTLQVQTDINGNNGKIMVGGGRSVTINGGTVSVLSGGGEYQPSTQYTLITAAGGVTGTFSNAITDFAFLTPSLTYDANDVFLTLARNDLAFNTVAKTTNQVKAASYLQSLGTDSGAAPVMNRVLQLTLANAPSAFASLSGNALTDLGHISQKLTGRLMDSLTNRLSGGFEGSRSFEYFPAELGLDALPTSDGGFLRESSLTHGLWVRNFNQQGGIRSDGNGAASNWLGGGTAVGFDLPLSVSTVIGASYLNSVDRVQLDSGRSGVARISTPQFVTYISHASAGDSFVGWQLRGLVGYSRPTISSSRAIVLGSDTTVATSTHSAQEVSAGGEADLSQNFSGIGLHEIVGLRASRMDEAGYREGGSSAALEVASRVSQSLVSSMGTHLAIPTSVADGLFDVRAMWRHELRDLNNGLSARLASSGSNARFEVDGTPMGRDSMTVGANYSARLGRNLSLYGDYSLDVSKETGAQHNLLAGFRYLW